MALPPPLTRPDGIVITPTRPEHAEALERLQITVFPNLADAERFKAPHYLKHIEIFPEGQFVALDGDRVVGMTSTIRHRFNPEDATHTFEEIIEGGWLTSHDPEGEWLYGADVGVHPDWRGRGIARSLYAARHETVRRLGLRGQVTVGMMNGYGAVKDRMTPEAYFEGVRSGEIIDPTVSAQMRIGFEPRALVKGYLRDPTCAGCGILVLLPAEREIERAR